MSYERALKALNLEETDRIPQVEFLEHPEFVKKLTGIDPWLFPQEAFVEAYKRLDLDLVYVIPTHSVKFKKDELVKEDEQGRRHTQWGIKMGGPWVIDRPFKTVEDVLRYDPTKLRRCKGSVSQMAENFNKAHQVKQKLMGRSALVPVFYGPTLFHFLVTTFGFELPCIAAMQEPKKMKELLERFASVSLKATEAWSLTDIKVFLSHDDLAHSGGLLFSPDWYRENIFPWYRKIWAPLKKRGIKILFFSDGQTSPIIDDVIETGADGFFIESVVDLRGIAQKYGDSKVIFGGIDTKILTFKREKAIEDEVKRCIKATKECRGYFLNASGSIPQNIPLSNVEAYFEACKKFRVR